MRIVNCFIFLLLTTAFFAQDKSIHELGNFHEIKVYNGLKVHLVPSDENRAEITGDSKETVTFEIEEGILKIRSSLDNIWKEDNTSVELYFKNIIGIDAKQNARVRLEGYYEGENFFLEASEGGSVYTELQVKNLYAKSLTGGQLEVKGETGFQEIKIRAGGKYYARYLASEDIDISISAGGVADVQASGIVKAKVRAGGTVNVYGTPENIEEDTLFGGKVNRKN